MGRKSKPETAVQRRAIFCLLFIFLTFHDGVPPVQAGSGEKKAPLGEVVKITPGASYEIPEHTTFPFSFHYSPGTSGLPPGSYFELTMPPYSPLSPKNCGRPDLRLNTKKYPPGVYLKIDPYHSSLSNDTPGCGEKISLVFEKGMEADEAFVLEMPITVMYMVYTRFHPIVTTKVDIKLYPGDGSTARIIETPNWRILPKNSMRFLISCPSQADTGEKIPVVLNFSGLFGRPVYEDVGKIWIEPMDNMQLFPGGPVEVLKEDVGRQALEVSFSKPGVYRLSATSETGLTALGNPVMVGEKKWENIYWGNLHSHTHYSWDQRNWVWGNPSPADVINDARDGYLLDFIAITDHGQHDVVIKGLHLLDRSMPSADMSPDDWIRYNLGIMGNKRDDIIAYVGYEHRDPRGDTVLIYRNEAPYFNINGRRVNLDQVWVNSEPGSLIGIPHLHPQAGINLYKTTFPHETLVEITSSHGTFEHYQCLQPGMSYLGDRLKISAFTKHLNPKGPFVRDLLDFGKRYGLMASEDHGCPGNLAITGLFSPEKNRDAVFDSLLARNTFATTGARMIIYLNCDGLLMGKEMVVEKNNPVRSSRRFDVEIYGTDKIQSVEMIRNGKIIKTDKVEAMDYKKTLVDDDHLDDISVLRPADQKRTTYYYLRVIQKDGHLGWSSPVFFILPD